MFQFRMIWFGAAPSSLALHMQIQYNLIHLSIKFKIKTLFCIQVNKVLSLHINLAVLKIADK
jgi:hypothetical protein